MEDQQSSASPKQTGFFTGLGVTLASAFIATLLLLYLAAMSQHIFFWVVVIIASVLPVLGIYLTVKWRREGKKAKSNGAMTAVVIGSFIAGGTTIWFIPFLNSLGG